MKKYVCILLFTLIHILCGCSSEPVQRSSAETATEESAETINTNEDSKNYYDENNWNKKIVNLQMADITMTIRRTML